MPNSEEVEKSMKVALKEHHAIMAALFFGVKGESEVANQALDEFNKIYPNNPFRRKDG